MLTPPCAALPQGGVERYEEAGEAHAEPASSSVAPERLADISHLDMAMWQGGVGADTRPQVHIYRYTHVRQGHRPQDLYLPSAYQRARERGLPIRD